ncbi:MAG: TRM11 family SAM-dependent methyltransferase [Gaiellaceae bacterium]
MAVWPCAQQTSQWQRHGRYLAECKRHPGKMLPELARRAISAYSEPGELVVDPMCGIGTTLVESIHLGRNALGIELERRWASLASANLAHARDQGASGRAGVIEGDARELPRLLTRGRRLLEPAPGRSSAKPRRNQVARLGSGSVDLVLTSPPYASEIGQIDKPAWVSGGSLSPKQSRNYSTDRDNLGHARGQRYRTAMAAVYAASAAVLKPGGFLVVVTKNLRAGGAMLDLAGDTIDLCRASGLLYWQHVIALLAAIRDDELVPRPSFWQLTATRKALTRGDRTHVVCHEDVLVFRKPAAASGVEPARGRTQVAEIARAA